MRRAFICELIRMAESDPSVVLLTGDLGFRVVEPFVDRFPDRFFNLGVAEQNMLGVATGLAAAGFTPFVYSIATFASMRGYEFWRNGALLHELPVRLVGVGGGVDYGHNGPTHYALEDIALMRVQPGLTVLAPADPEQTTAAVRATAGYRAPVYLRLGKGGTSVPGLDGRFDLGRAALIGDGADLAIIAYGAIAIEAVKARNLLARVGVSATVAVTASLAPPPVGDLVDLLQRAPLAITMETHYPTGGVGSLVAELITDRGLTCRLLRRAITSMPRGEGGDPDYLYRRYGLTAEQVTEAVLSSAT